MFAMRSINHFILLCIVFLCSCDSKHSIERKELSQKFIEAVLNNKFEMAWSMCSDTLYKISDIASVKEMREALVLYTEKYGPEIEYYSFESNYTSGEGLYTEYYYKFKKDTNFLPQVMISALIMPQYPNRISDFQWHFFDPSRIH